MFICESLIWNFDLIARWDIFIVWIYFCTLHIQISNRAVLKGWMVARLYQEISKQKRKRKSKTNKIIQVNPKTQHEKETLLLAIGEKRFEVFFPYLMYMSSRPIVW